ncbi:MAG: NAD(+) diphosphatase [Janthinobacterium lividum]
MITSSDTLVRAYPPAVSAPGPAIWLPFYRGELLTHLDDAGSISLHRGNIGSVEALNLRASLYLGTLGGTPCMAAEADPDCDLPEGWVPANLRSLFGKVSEAEYSLTGYASQVLYWRRTSVFCPVCGHRTEARGGDWGRKCPECGHVGYPHISPATLILVHDGPRLLLAQKPGWGTRWSILAGFVEPGESLEECVHREVKEEVGIHIDTLVYAGCQPWPFPNQLMIGFTAQYVGGEVQPDHEELERAAWFTRETLPDLPPAVSLSRQMIDAWVSQK